MGRKEDVSDRRKITRWYRSTEIAGVLWGATGGGWSKNGGGGPCACVWCMCVGGGGGGGKQTPCKGRLSQCNTKTRSSACAPGRRGKRRREVLIMGVMSSDLYLRIITLLWKH